MTDTRPQFTKHRTLAMAAPDLLTALEMLVEEAREDDRNPSLTEAFDQARAAIAKARNHSASPQCLP